MIDAGQRSGVRLSSAGVELASPGELRVRPFILFDRWGRNWFHDNDRGTLPIGGGGMNPPNIPRLLKGESDQPVFVPGSKRHAVRYSCSDHHTRRQLIQTHGQTRFQRSRQAYAAPLRVHHQGVATLRKFCTWIQTGHAHGKLCPDAGRSACSFG